MQVELGRVVGLRNTLQNVTLTDSVNKIESEDAS